MGSICSKQSAYSEGHTVLDSSHSAQLSQSGVPSIQSSDPRTAAANAAEKRLKAAQERGTNQSNPNRGRLAAQVELSKAAAANRAPEAQEGDRLVWD